MAHLDAALQSPDNAALLGSLVLPAGLAGRSQAEQAEFVRKSLSTEVSSEGLAELRRHGKFGPLLELFPEEATHWASQAGVRAEDCVALRLDRANGPRAEVVLVRAHRQTTGGATSSFRIVRCNNVTQLANPEAK